MTRVSGSATRPLDRAVDGIVLLDKPAGLTSNRALQRARRAFRARKAGHGGSLDPLATGMLPLCFGQATKVCGALLGSSKRYRARVVLGRSTTTGDAEGETVAVRPCGPFTDAQIRDVLSRHQGELLQVPPMYSALKVGGRRLYELARRGETVDRCARPITVHHIELIACEPEAFEFELVCSKGTYVRSLAESIAEALGTVGHLGALRRLAVDPYLESQMVSLEAIEDLSVRDPPALTSLLLPADSALSALPAIDLDPGATDALLHGRRVEVGTALAGAARAYGPEKLFLGVVEPATDGGVRVRRLFVPGAGDRAPGPAPELP